MILRRPLVSFRNAGPHEHVVAWPLGSVLPMSRVLVTGMSGTGKSSALAELARHGYRVVDTGDPGWREYREYVESSDELHRGEWLWVEERITGLLDSDDGRSLFVEGCVRNQSKFYDRFNAVVLLSAPADVILDRVAPQNDEQLREDSIGTSDDLG